MKNSVNLIPGLILILTISVALANYTFDCKEYETPVILETHFCKIDLPSSFNNSSEILMASLPHPNDEDTFRSAEIVILDPRSRNVSLLINDTNTFSSLFPAVRILTIRGIHNFSFSEHLENETTQLKENLFNLTNLDHLSITDAQLENNASQWHLPANLLHLNFSGNRYTEYNLENFTHLEVVDFSRNNLTEIPAMRFPLPSLTELYVDNNSLNKVKVEDIARLCFLKKLTLTGTSFESPTVERFCECQKLKRWIAKVQNWMRQEHYDQQFIEHAQHFGGDFQCHSPAETTNCSQIMESKWSLGESVGIREYCLTGKSYKNGETNNFLLGEYNGNEKPYAPVSFQNNNSYLLS